MRKFSKSLFLASAIALAPVALTTASWAEEFRAMQEQGEWVATSLIGQTVKNAAGESVGDVNDLLFDDDGKLTAIVVGVGGFLGIAEKNVAIAESDTTVTWNNDGDPVVTVKATKDALERAPAFKRLHDQKAKKTSG